MEVTLCLFVFFVHQAFASRFVLVAKCQTNLQEKCVEIRQCPYFAELLSRSSIPRPRGVIKSIRERQCGFHGKTPKVCCSFSEIKVKTTSTELSRMISDDLALHKNYYLLPNNVCGAIPADSRITSGSKTSLGEFPWMALIAYYTNEGLDFRCGGTLITEQFVLTAAHCILNSSIVGVRLGEQNLDTLEDCDEQHCAPPVQDFYIENIVVHPLYNARTFENDIALVKLASKANFTENVKPICLPVDGEASSSNVDMSGRFGIVSGWGITETGLKSSELLKVSLPIVPIQECQAIYQRYAPIHKTQICAGGQKGQDSCGGDSGGPLKYVGPSGNTQRYIQYGIVSYGPRHCGTEGQPGIYTRVSSYLEWILDNLQA